MGTFLFIPPGLHYPQFRQKRLVVVVITHFYGHPRRPGQQSPDEAARLPLTPLPGPAMGRHHPHPGELLPGQFQFHLLTCLQSLCIGKLHIPHAQADKPVVGVDLFLGLCYFLCTDICRGALPCRRHLRGPYRFIYRLYDQPVVPLSIQRTYFTILQSYTCLRCSFYFA